VSQGVGLHVTSRLRFISTVRIASTALVLLCAVSAVGASQFHRQLTSDHFRITYISGFGADAVTANYARLVQESLETAYNILVTQRGLPIFQGRINVDILPSLFAEMGAEYLDHSTGEPRPVIEIATEAVIEESLNEMFVNLTLEDLVLSTAAHELFHVIQDYASLHGMGDISEQTFVEAHATAIQELVAPQANDYLDPGLDFLLAPDSMAFFQRTYDAAVFWVFVMNRFSGPEPIIAVMEASAAYEGLYAADRALEDLGSSFDDLWAEFAVAFATQALPDQDAIVTLTRFVEEEVEWELGSSPATTLTLPTPVYVGEWLGNDLTVDHVNNEGWGSLFGIFNEDPHGAPLRVAHAYGIDVIEIRPVARHAPVSMTFSGNKETDFHVIVAVNLGGSWTTTSLSPDLPWIPPASAEFDCIRIVITRGEAGTGTYSLYLSATEP